MLLEDNNDEYDKSDEDEDGILLAAVFDDKNEDNRKIPAVPALPAIPAAGNEKSKSESSTNKPALPAVGNEKSKSESSTNKKQKNQK